LPVKGVLLMRGSKRKSRLGNSAMEFALVGLVLVPLFLGACPRIDGRTLIAAGRSVVVA